MTAAAAVVRLATAQDLPSILRINAASTPHVARLVEADLGHMASGRAQVWVVAQSADVWGYLIAYSHRADYEGEEFNWFKAAGGDFLYVDQVAVAAEARAMGIGSRLYAHLADCASGDGAGSLVCEVNLRPPNPRSLGFHARLGFFEAGRLETRDGRAVVLLKKSLAAQAAVARAVGGILRPSTLENES